MGLDACDIILRRAEPGDREGVTHLIDTVYTEYGELLCLEGADADLHDIVGNYDGRGGAFIVLDRGGEVVGSHAALPLAERPGVCTFRRLYLDGDLRGTQWGVALMQWTIDWARDHGMRRVEFWSDTRFERAHEFFERFGFRRDGRIREMNDGFELYREYFFWMDLVSG